MNGTTHLAVGAAIGAWYVTVPPDLWVNDYALRPDTLPAKLALVAVCMVGSLLPDIDHARSLISQRVGPVGWVVRLFMSHRGLTHTFLFGGLITLGLSIVHPQLAGVFAMGYLSHLVLDMLTPAGVRLYYPVFDTSFVLAPRRVLGVMKPALELCLLLGAIMLIGVSLWQS
jgi:inner membrane protein